MCCFKSKLRVHSLGFISFILFWSLATVVYAQQVSDSQTSEVGVAEDSFGVSTVAVIPFNNISKNPEDEWLSEGIVETIVSDLATSRRLSVVGFYEFMGQDFLISREFLDELRMENVDWVITGGIQRIVNTLRITARVVSVETGETYRTSKIDGEFDELFILQDRIAEDLASDITEVVSRDFVSDSLARSTSDETSSLENQDTGGALGPFSKTPEIRPQSIPEAVSTEIASMNQVTAGLQSQSSQSSFGIASGVGALNGRPSVRPTRAQVPPSIDGVLDDPIWQEAAHITEFVQLTPLDGAPSSEESDVYVAYDSSHLYLGFKARFSDPSMLRANRKDRDIRTGDDTFWVYFDPFLDQQRAYGFSVNAYGVQMDAIISSRGGSGFGGRFGGGGGGLPFGDQSWNALFDTAGQKVSDGFTAEMAIPFKSLRYPQRDGSLGHQWGFQIARRIRGRNETAVWAPVSREISGFLPQMGLIEGMTDLSTSRNIEILPTFTAVQFGSLNQGGSFVNDKTKPEGGINFKYGVTSNLTADVTYNPDFSQIESDQPQIEVNQRYALFFPELRPFFLEGAEIFNIRAPVRVVDTRTIVDPRYGAKLTGKTGKTTIGVMYANDESLGNIDDSFDPSFGQASQTFVGRVRYDLYSESHVGAIFTDREFLNSYSRLAGFDSNFRLGSTYELGVRILGTQNRDLDGHDTTGHLLNANIAKRGRNLSFLFAGYSLSPDFQTDVGFVRRTDQRWMFSEVAYRWWPENWLVNWGPRFRYNRSHNFDGILEDENINAGIDMSFAKSVNFNASLFHDMERFGGINFVKDRYRFFGVVSAIRQFSFGLGGRGGDQIFFDEENPYLGSDRGWNGFLNLRLIPQLESRINIDTNRFVDVRGEDTLVFDVNIFRALTTYQFSDRLSVRNISEYNSFDKELSLNLLFTYRINAGTAFYVGYDDRYQQTDRIERDIDGDGFDDRFFPSTLLKRTNRAFFTKIQYLFRY